MKNLTKDLEKENLINVEPYDLGWHHGIDDKSFECCPYKKGTLEYTQYRNGYNDGHQVKYDE